MALPPKKGMAHLLSAEQAAWEAEQLRLYKMPIKEIKEDETNADDI